LEQVCVADRRPPHEGRDERWRGSGRRHRQPPGRRHPARRAAVRVL